MVSKEVKKRKTKELGEAFVKIMCSGAEDEIIPVSESVEVLDVFYALMRKSITDAAPKEAFPVVAKKADETLNYIW